MAKYQLIGAQISYYTGKVRAYMRYKEIPFDEVLCTAEVFAEVIVPRTGVNYIPVLITPEDEVVQDSTDIIDFLEARFPEPSIYPDARDFPLQRLVALLFELYADEWLIIPAMHYRWAHPENAEFVLREFGAVFRPDSPPETWRDIGDEASAYFRDLRLRIGATEALGPAIEAWTEELLGQLDLHFKEFPYLLGTRPSIGDYGLMGAIYAHLYRDPYSGRLIRAHTRDLARWVERMNAPVPKSGAFLAADTIPETLTPILARMFAEQFPIILDTGTKLAAWLDANPAAAEIERSIGKHTFKIGAAEDERDIFPFTLWMLQRVQAHYATIDGEAKAPVDAYLKSLGGYEAMNTQLPVKVKREHNRLVAA